MKTENTRAACHALLASLSELTVAEFVALVPKMYPSPVMRALQTRREEWVRARVRINMELDALASSKCTVFMKGDDWFYSSDGGRSEATFPNPEAVTRAVLARVEALGARARINNELEALKSKYIEECIREGRETLERIRAVLLAGEIKENRC